MGTRADFYVGIGAKAEWLGSVGWDGYEWAEDKECALMRAASEDDYRAAVEQILVEREDATRPAQGWPWPWPTSATTDYTYAFDGTKTIALIFDKKHAWPDMTSQQNVTLGQRSGAMVFTVPEPAREGIEVKLSIPKRALLRALERVASCVDRKSSMAILSSIHLAARDGVLTLSGTDLYIGAIATVPAKVDEPGVLCVPAKTLVDIVKNAADSDVTLSSEPSHHLTIRVAKSKFRVHGQPGTDYPELPKPDGDRFVALSARHLADVLDVTAISMSTDDTRPHLAGVKLEWADNVLRAVSTDGHRMTKAETTAGRQGIDILIPHKGVHEVRRLAAEVIKDHGKPGERVPEVGVQVAPAPALALFVRTPDAVLSVKLADEQFPPYAKVIPQRHKARVIVLRETLLDAARRITVVAGDRAGGLQLRFDAGVLRVGATNVDIGEGAEEIDVDYAGEPLTIGMNARYLVEPLASMAGDEVALELGGDLDPVVIKPTKSDLDVIAVVMPMRI